MGPETTMAYNIAVEEVKGLHYQKQANILGDEERGVQANFERFRDEELEYRDTAVDYQGREARHYKLLRNVTKRGYRAAIKIAERV